MLAVGLGGLATYSSRVLNGFEPVTHYCDEWASGKSPILIFSGLIVLKGSDRSTVEPRQYVLDSLSIENPERSLGDKTDMGCRNHIGKRYQAVPTLNRFVVEHIYGGTRNLVVGESCNECILIDERATRRVHEPSRPLHQSEFVTTDHTSRAIGEDEMEGDPI
ncbi:hypothetical protein D3C71_1432570 [compost metagenome]